MIDDQQVVTDLVERIHVPASYPRDRIGVGIHLFVEDAEPKRLCGGDLIPVLGEADLQNCPMRREKIPETP